MLFVKRNWLQDKASLEAVFKRVKTERPPIWLVSFIEGTRITKKNHKESIAFAKSRNLPILNNLLLPRMKGFCATVQQLRDTHVKNVYDLTLAYKNHVKGTLVAPNIVRAHSYALDDFQFHIHVRKFSISQLPEDEQELSKWMYDFYVKKDAYLEGLKTKWPKEGDVDEGLDGNKSVVKMLPFPGTWDGIFA